MAQRSILDRGIFIANCLFALLLFLACFVPHIPVTSFPLLSLLSLGVPLLVLVNMAFCVYWLFRKTRNALLSLLALAIGYLTLGSFIRFDTGPLPAKDKDLTLMSYNVRGFNKYDWIDDPELGDKIIDFVDRWNPDVICFQEFSAQKHKELRNYPYRYVSYGIINGSKKTIQAIFSKHAIIAKGTLDFPNTVNTGIFADIAFAGDTLRVYNLHLQSFGVVPDTDAIVGEDSKKLADRLGRSLGKQQEQAVIFDEHRKTSPYRNIVCGDLNNTQFSNVYKTIRGDMQDTFDEKGSGYGATYYVGHLPLRIDFILADPAFEIISHRNFEDKLSDHFPIMASLRSRVQK